MARLIVSSLKPDPNIPVADKTRTSFISSVSYFYQMTIPSLLLHTGLTFVFVSPSIQRSTAFGFFYALTWRNKKGRILLVDRGADGYRSTGNRL